MLQNKSHESQVRENATSYMLKKRYPESQVYIIYRVSQKNIVFRNIAKTLIKLPFRSVKGRSGGSHICRHIGDMGTCARHPVMAQMCSAPQNTHIQPLKRQEFCYIPKDNIFLGHPVYILLGILGSCSNPKASGININDRRCQILNPSFSVLGHTVVYFEDNLYIQMYIFSQLKCHHILSYFRYLYIQLSLVCINLQQPNMAEERGIIQKGILNNNHPH